MKEFKDFRVVNTVVSSSKSIVACVEPGESIVQNIVYTDDALAENTVIKSISAAYW